MNLLQPSLPYALVRSRRRTIAIHANRASVYIRVPIISALPNQDDSVTTCVYSCDSTAAT